jgi:surface protein
MSHKTLQHIKQLHDKVFGVDNDHIMLDPNENEMPYDVVEFLESKGINTTSKINNHVFDALTIMYNDRAIDLLKFLGKNKAPQSVITSAENYYRPIKSQSSNDDVKILISRKNAEIASGATCTSWDSCLNPTWETNKGRSKFEGPAWQKIPDEIKYGTLIAYVLRASATPNEDGEYNAKGPDGKDDKIGRVLIKMFESNSGDMVFVVEDNKVYGNVTNSQLKIIKKWVATNYHTKEGLYNRNRYTYNDSGRDSQRVINKPTITFKPETTEELKELVRKYQSLDDLNFIDVSEITDMTEVFDETEFDGDISKWDVSNVTNMFSMFSYSKFNGDISKWNVSSVENMKAMFTASQFNSNILKWNVSNVNNMALMFSMAKFNSDISNWNVSNVTDMSQMFYNAEFTGNISQWNVSPKTIMYEMFFNSPLENNPPNWYH